MGDAHAREREDQELYHEIFGSVLDRKELTPYLLRNCSGYDDAMRGATTMMANRGFIVDGGKIAPGELDRAGLYVSEAIGYLADSLLPSVSGQLAQLSRLSSHLRPVYGRALADIRDIDALISKGEFRTLVDQDPRHLFLLASSAKYPHVFAGSPSGPDRVPPRWRMGACAILKLCHLIKAIEEDSEDVYDYARLGFWFESRKLSLTSLASRDWANATDAPEDPNGRRAYVKLATFFRKLSGFLEGSAKSGTLRFVSGDGVSVELVEIKARLKSPESMFAKIGKAAAEETYNIRDILALTFLIKRREDSLTLFHALQKQGVILQENVEASSVTQTLFDSAEDMRDAVRVLMRTLARREGVEREPDETEVARNAEDFFRALGTNAQANRHSAGQHRKFQCKINFSVPVQYDRETGRVLVNVVPGAPGAVTRQHTLPVELRISDIASWEASELRGEAHHAAYKMRQHLVLMNRLLSPLFTFPAEAFSGLRRDQDALFR